MIKRTRYHFQYDLETKIITGTGSSTGIPDAKNVVELRYMPARQIGGLFYSETEQKAYQFKDGKIDKAVPAINLEIIKDPDNNDPIKRNFTASLKTIADDKLTDVISQHEEWIKRGRNSKDGTRADLEGYDLQGKDFSDHDLSYSKFVFCDFSNANLKGSNFNYADLQQSTFTSATRFNNSYLEYAVFDQVVFEGTQLIGSHCLEASFKNADLSNSNVLGSDFRKCNFTKAKLNHIERASNADFTEADMTDCEMSNSDFSEASFKKAILIRSTARNSFFKSVDFEYANLDGAALEETDLSNANLAFARNVRLDACRIIGTRFTPAYSKKSIKENFYDDRFDIWNVLRREYTGTKFSIYILLTLAYFIPVFFKLLLFKSIEYLEGAKLIKIMILNHSWKTIAFWQLLFKTHSTHLEMIMASLLVIYNSIRCYLTVKISTLNDEVKYTGISPPLRTYKKMIVGHYVIKIIFWVVIAHLLFTFANALFIPVYIPSFLSQ